MTGDLRDRIARALFIEGVGPEAAAAWDAPGDGGRQRWWNYADAVIAELGLTEEARCPQCGIDLRYPTALHIVDCGKRVER